MAAGELELSFSLVWLAAISTQNLTSFVHSIQKTEKTKPIKEKRFKLSKMENNVMFVHDVSGPNTTEL